MFNKILFTTAIFLVGITGIDCMSAEVQKQPFRAGEKITFQIKWTAIPAGEMVIETLPVEKINGEDSRHIILTVTSNSFVDMFYKIRDRMDSYTDLNFTHSVMYAESRQGKRPKDTSIEFNWVKEQARYIRKGETEKSDPISIQTGTFDPLSAFLAFRQRELNETKEITIAATDGKVMINGKINVVKKETITVNGIKYDTFLLEPELRGIGGVFESKDSGAQIWVTADNRKIPVRIKSQLPFGSFIADLVSYNEGISENGDERR
jgi:hypothetical protein